VRIAFATCSALPDGWPDDHPAAALLGAEMVPWDDPTARWEDYDRVIVRSVFDYAQRFDQFLGWCDRVGAARLRNTPELIRFNADKRYLADLRTPTVPSVFVGPHDELPDLEGRSW
jgi:hypothetical protein